MNLKSEFCLYLKTEGVCITSNWTNTSYSSVIYFYYVDEE